MEYKVTAKVEWFYEADDDDDEEDARLAFMNSIINEMNISDIEVERVPVPYVTTSAPIHIGTATRMYVRAGPQAEYNPASEASVEPVVIGLPNYHSGQTSTVTVPYKRSI